MIELARSIKTADPKLLDYKTLFINSCLFVARNITDDALQLNSAGQADEKTKLLAEAERLVREALATLDETGRQEKPNDASETLREELIEVLKDIERVKSANE